MMRSANPVEHTPFEEIVPYLSAPQRAFLRALWNEEEYHRLEEPALREAVSEADEEATFSAVVDGLKNWNLVADAGHATGGDRDGRNDRYQLARRGAQLMEQYEEGPGNDLADAAVPIEEWGPAEWKAYPGDLEDKFHLLLGEFLALRERVEE